MGETLKADLKAIDPPWGCAPTGSAFVCNRTQVVTLQPGQDDSFRVTITPHGFAQAYINCAEITSPLALADPARGCVTVTEPSVLTLPLPQFQKPNIQIRKIAPNSAGTGNVGHCTFSGPCRFQIEVTNKGQAPYKGKIRILDTVEGGNPTSMSQWAFSKPGWHCNSVGEAGLSHTITCETDNEITLAPGETLAFLEVDVIAGPSWKNAATNVLRNCAEFSYQFGNDPGDLKGDDKHCADVKLDPFNVKVAKTGDQTCLPDGECRFDIDLFNPGPIPHDAPVTITDGLAGIASAPITSITGDKPWPCAVSPTQIPFKCTTPGNHPLSVGQHEHWSMTIRLPAGASGASFTNCAIVSAARLECCEAWHADSNRHASGGRGLGERSLRLSHGQDRRGIPGEEPTRPSLRPVSPPAMVA